ncbi:hypothetical protein, partial [uncultured Duncaniella sp.]
PSIYNFPIPPSNPQPLKRTIKPYFPPINPQPPKPNTNPTNQPITSPSTGQIPKQHLTNNTRHSSPVWASRSGGVLFFHKI